MAFIRSITIESYKRFKKFSVSCKTSNILVGPNNAGKSTVLDALRIINSVHRYTSRTKPLYREHDGFGGCATFELPNSLIGVPISNVVHNYGDDPARITVALDNGSTLHVLLHPEHSVVVFLETEHRTPRTPAEYRALVPLNLVIVPTLSSLEENEEYVLDDTVSRNENTRLASRNFRNIVLRKSFDDFDSFSKLATSGWPNITVLRPEVVRRDRAYVVMMYEENRIPREIYWSGFGFQVWMQMTLQFMRGDADAILVLDEPDIYLHPDLQKRMLRMVKDRFGQIFIATHSAEIINDADGGDILLISSENKTAKRVTTDDAYKRLYSYIGSSENAEFARLARADRIVFFEGQDKRIIKKLALKARCDEIFQDSKTAYLQAGGFSQWIRIREVDWALHNIFGLDVRIAALFDRDFRCLEEIERFHAELANEHLWVKVLERKEIENYVLVLRPLIDCIIKRLAERDINMSENDAYDIIRNLTEEFRNSTVSQQVANYIRYHGTVDRSVDLSTHIQRANNIFEGIWSNVDGRLRIITGKEFISLLSTRLQRDYRVTITLNQILDEMRHNEIPEDLVASLNEMAAFLRR